MAAPVALQKLAVGKTPSPGAAGGRGEPGRPPAPVLWRARWRGGLGASEGPSTARRPRGAEGTAAVAAGGLGLGPAAALRQRWWGLRPALRPGQEREPGAGFSQQFRFFLCNSQYSPKPHYHLLMRPLYSVTCNRSISLRKSVFNADYFICSHNYISFG